MKDWIYSIEGKWVPTVCVLLTISALVLGLIKICK